MAVKLILSLALILMVLEACIGLRAGAPIFPKFRGVKVNNDYHYKELWYPQTVSVDFSLTYLSGFCKCF